MKKIFPLVLIILSLIYSADEFKSVNYKEGVFQNLYITHEAKMARKIGFFWDFLFNPAKDAIPQNESDIPVYNLTKNDLLELENNSVVRLSHSSLLLKLNNEFILTDPIFSERASNFSFVGPKRFHKNPIEIESLPKIKAVVISHDHYDHLDEKSIHALKDKVEIFYVPLGVKKHLLSFGVKQEQVIELDWYEKTSAGNIEFICTPAQHYSGRGFFDKDSTLWASWVIKTKEVNLFFGGDSGYFKEFKKIASLYGPFDMSFLEVGAYNKKWRNIHMLPIDAIQAHKDLNAKVLFPIHNGTFSMSFHPWYEPFEKINQLANDHKIDLRLPKMGEPISIVNKTMIKKWWE